MIMTTTPMRLVAFMGWRGDPSQPKCDRTMPLKIWPTSRASVNGPAPTCGISHAMPNTSVAPMAPAVSMIGLTEPRPLSAPACQPVAPMTRAVMAPMTQNSAFPTRGLFSAAPTTPFIAR